MIRKPVGFRLPAETVASLRRQAERHDMTLTQYIIVLVDRESRSRKGERFELEHPNRMPISIRPDRTE